MSARDDLAALLRAIPTEFGGIRRVEREDAALFAQLMIAEGVHRCADALEAERAPVWGVPQPEEHH